MIRISEIVIIRTFIKKKTYRIISRGTKNKLLFENIYEHDAFY